MCSAVLLHLHIHHEAYFKGGKLFHVHSNPRIWRLLLLPGFHAGKALSWGVCHLATIVAVSLIRVVKLTPLNNHLDVFLLCLQSKSQTRCKLPWLKSELVLRTKHPHKCSGIYPVPPSTAETHQRKPAKGAFSKCHIYPSQLPYIISDDVLGLHGKVLGGGAG